MAGHRGMVANIAAAGSALEAGRRVRTSGHRGRARKARRRKARHLARPSLGGSIIRIGIPRGRRATGRLPPNLLATSHCRLGRARRGRARMGHARKAGFVRRVRNGMTIGRRSRFRAVHSFCMASTRWRRHCKIPLGDCGG